MTIEFFMLILIACQNQDFGIQKDCQKKLIKCVERDTIPNNTSFNLQTLEKCLLK